MLRSTLSAFVVIGAALPVFAQSGLGDISQNCQNAFVKIIGDSEASTCLNANGLVTAVSKTGANDSLVQPATDWVTGMCAAGPCSNSTLEMVVRTVADGCSAELGKAGFSTSDTGDLVKYVQMGYPTVRKVLCLKDNDANKLCVNEDLSAIETAMGRPLSVSNLMGVTNLTLLMSVPKDKICSSCNKAIYTIVKQDFSSLVSGADTLVSTECGSDFVNGEMPSSIQQTAAAESKSSNSKGGNNNGAASLAINGAIGAISAVGVLSALVAF